MKHNRMKQFTSIILAIALVFGAAISAFAADMVALAAPATAKTADFSDMRPENHWAYKALTYAVENGLMQGSDGKLNPSENLTRAEMATITNNVFGATEKADISQYKDVKTSDWFYESFAKAVKMKTFNGIDEATMSPKGNITRQDAFVVIARVLQLETDDYSALNKFSDANEISDYAKGYIAALAEAGYANGSDGKLNPLSTITREAIAQIFYNVIQNYALDNKTITGEVDGNLLVRVPGVTVKNAAVKGDIIVADGVGDGEFTLDNVKIAGRLLVRGGGEHSIVIKNRSSVGNVVVSKTASGAVRVYCEKGSVVDVVRIDDCSDEIKIEGSFVSVEVQTDRQVNLANADVAKLNINAENANVNIESGKVAEVTVAETAKGAEIATGKNSTVGLLLVNADAKVEAAGTIKKTEAAENVQVQGLETAKKEEKPSGGGGASGGGGEFEPTPGSIVFVVKNEEELKNAIDNEEIKTIAIAESFELNDQVRFGGLKEKVIIVNSGVCITVPGISVGTNARFTNKGTINLRNGYLYVDEGATFECSGTLNTDADSWITVSGTIGGNGTFNGNARIFVQAGAVVNWPTNVKFEFGGDDLFYGASDPRSRVGSASVEYGPNIPAANKADFKKYAYIYNQEGLEQYLDVTSTASIYDRVYFWECSDLIINDVIHADDIVFRSSTVTIAAEAQLNANESIEICNGSIVTNAGTILAGTIRIDDGYSYEGNNHVYTEGAFTAFINKNMVTLQSEYYYALYIQGTKAYAEHQSGKFSIQGQIVISFGGKLRIDTSVTSAGSDFFSVVSGNSNDILLAYYVLDDRELISGVEGADGLQIRKQLTIYDASKLDEIMSSLDYDIAYIEDELEITEDKTITKAIQVDKLTVKEGKTLTLDTGNDYSSEIINIVVETNASLIIAGDANLQIGNQYYNERTDSITGECGYINYGTIENNGRVNIRYAYKYGDSKPQIEWGQCSGAAFSTTGNVYVSNKADLIAVLKDDEVVDARICYYGSLQINPEDNFPVVEKSIDFSNSGDGSDVEIVIATGASFVVSGSGVAVHFSSNEEATTMIYGTLQLVNNPQVVLYDAIVNGTIESDGRLFIADDVVLNGSLLNKHQIVIEYNATLNSYGTITNESGARILCGRPEHYGDNTSKGNVIIYDGIFTNEGSMNIINGSSVIVNKLNDVTTFTNSGTIDTNTTWYSDTTYSTGTLVINAGVTFSNTGTIDTANGLMFENHSQE